MSNASIGISDLTKEQLFKLVQVRGQFVQMSSDLDNGLHQALLDGATDLNTFPTFFEKKNKLLADLATAEERIMAGASSSSH
jgi:hypothetical protein